MATNQAPRPVVVGVDGSPGARAALKFAFEEALTRGAAVRVVTTWMLGFPQRDTISERAWDEESAEAHRLQDAEIGWVLHELGRRPEFSQVVVNDLSGPTLVDLARDASLLVVGTGRKNAVSRAFLGSVSEFCVRHSPAPVVVVPDPVRAAAGDQEEVMARLRA